MEYGANFIKPSEMWKEIKPRIGEMLVAINDIETRYGKAVDEAYQSGYDDGKGDSSDEDAYQRGLTDAWDAARTLWNTPNRKEIFGHTTFNTVLTTLTAQETIEKIRQYEQAQKELEQEKEEKPIRAEDVMRQYLTEFCKKHSCRDRDCALHTPDFTCGRGYHFLTDSLVSDEEVRRAYAKVVKCKSCEVQKL